MDGSDVVPASISQQGLYLDAMYEDVSEYISDCKGANDTNHQFPEIDFSAYAKHKNWVPPCSWARITGHPRFVASEVSRSTNLWSFINKQASWLGLTEKPETPVHLVEYACGYGHATAALSPYVTTATAIDWAPKIIYSFADAVKCEYSPGTLTPLVGEWTIINEPDQRFKNQSLKMKAQKESLEGKADILVLAFGIDCISCQNPSQNDVDQAVLLLASVLKPGGVMIVIDTKRGVGPARPGKSLSTISTGFKMSGVGTAALGKAFKNAGMTKFGVKSKKFLPKLYHVDWNDPLFEKVNTNENWFMMKAHKAVYG